MKRKVVKQGPATYMVSLPKEWVRNNSIVKGQEMEVEMDNKVLKMSPVTIKPERKKEEAHIENWTYVNSIIRKFYRYGCHELNITYEEEEAKELIKKLVNSLIGADIIDEGDKRFQIIITDPERELDISKEIVSVLYKTQDMINMLIEDFDKEKFKRHEEFREEYLLIVKRAEYILRSVFMRRESHEKFTLINRTVHSLYRISMRLKFFYRVHLSKMKKIQGKEKIIKYLETYNELLRETIKRVQMKAKPEQPEDLAFRDKITDVLKSIFKEVDKREISGSMLVTLYACSSDLDSFNAFLYLLKRQGDLIYKWDDH